MSKKEKIEESRSVKAARDFNFFITIVSDMNPNVDVAMLRKAYEFSKSAHKEERRASGEPYFVHPVDVCLILVDNRIADTPTLCSALLHDVIEDTENEKKDLEKMFGEEIAEIVDGLTKLNKDRFKEGKNFNFDAYNSENLRKMILAAAKDSRVIFVKIADRLNNLRTLDIFRDDKKQRIAKQSLRVYAPLSEKLGLYTIKSEIEDLCLLTLKPEIYTYLAKNIQLTKKQRDEKTHEIIDEIKQLLKIKKINAKIIGRAKHYYSIYKKMSKENRSLDSIYDIYGVRIIVDNLEECYIVEKLLEDKWELQKDKITQTIRYKDYIKNPKPNGYQSIHINFKYEDGVVEAQIRTKDMDDLAESGVAKHWRYKKNERDKKLDRKIDWLRQIITWKRDPKNKNVAEKIQFDVFSNEIICITPKGDLVIINDKSTPLDFAYAIHSNIGNHYEKATINNEPVLINQQLKSGDIVNITTSKKPMVSNSWLNVVQTNQAKTKIRQYLGLTKQTTPKKPTKEDIIEFNLESKIDVLGRKAPIKLSKCCNPKFGDEITGYYTKDKKITIHKLNCPDRFALNQKNEVKVEWIKENKSEIKLFIVSEDRPGVLTEILDILIKNKCHIISFKSRERKRNIGISVVISKINKDCVNTSLKKIQSLPGFISAKLDS